MLRGWLGDSEYPICYDLPLFATVRHSSHYSRLFALFAIRYSGLFAVRYSGFPDTLPSPALRATAVPEKSEMFIFSGAELSRLSNSEKLTRFKIAAGTSMTFAGDFFTEEIEK